MFKKSLVLVFLSIFAFGLLFVCCDGGGSSSSSTKYTITFDPNGGSGSMSSVVTEENGVIRLPLCGFSAPSDISMPANTVGSGKRVFVCWNTKADGTGDIYKGSETYNGLETFRDDTKLYAQWSAPTFKVSDSKKVYFSKGNLYWNGSAYNLEDNQYNIPSNGARDASHVVHFFWVKSTETAILPYDASYGTPAPAESEYDKFFADNGGAISGFRTLSGGDSDSEWYYLLNTRECMTANVAASPSVRYAQVKVNGVCGLLVFPDVFVWTQEMGNTPTDVNQICTNYTAGSYSLAEFAKLEEAGVVFLPAAGWCNPSGDIYSSNSEGYYWSGTPDGATAAAYICFDETSVKANPSGTYARNNRNSIRLVKDAE